jgi:hypothetical protein
LIVCSVIAFKFTLHHNFDDAHAIRAPASNLSSRRKTTDLRPSMSAPKLALSLLLCTLLAGCKDIINPNTPIAATLPTSVTGNWLVYNVSFPVGGNLIGIGAIGGPITQSASTLTGTFHIANPCFGNGQTPIPLTGSITQGNHFTLTSPSVDGETLILTGTFSATGTTFNQGYLGIAGTCTGDLISQTGDQSGSIVNPVGTQIPNLSRSWAYYPGFSSPNLSEQLTQSPTPDAQGRFALTGTATIVGSPCFTSGVLQPGSYISGSLGQQIILLNDGSTFTSPITAFQYGSIQYDSPQPTPVTLQLYPGKITGGNCNGPANVDLQ